MDKSIEKEIHERYRKIFKLFFFLIFSKYWSTSIKCTYILFNFMESFDENLKVMKHFEGLAVSVLEFIIFRNFHMHSY